MAVEYKSNKTAILTGSKSGCLALKNPKGNEICIGIHKLAEVSCNIQCIEIHYIPSHKGLKENEMVDAAAKRAINDGEILCTKWTKKEAIREIENSLWREWERDYNLVERNKGKEYKKLFPTMKRKPWFFWFGLNPIQIKQINRIMTNKTYSPHALAQMAAVDVDICFTCNAIEDDSHVLFQCTKYRHQRSKYPVLTRYNNTFDFLKNESCNSYRAITEFLQVIEYKL